MRSLFSIIWQAFYNSNIKCNFTVPRNKMTHTFKIQWDKNSIHGLWFISIFLILVAWLHIIFPRHVHDKDYVFVYKYVVTIVFIRSDILLQKDLAIALHFLWCHRLHTFWIIWTNGKSNMAHMMLRFWYFFDIHF